MKRLSTLIVLALVSSTVAFGTPARAAVPSPSPGCQALNSPSRDGVYGSANTDGFGIGWLSSAPLAAGETVTITTSNPSAGLTLTYLEMYDPTVSFTPIISLSGPTPGTVSYTLTTDWNGAQQSMDWGVGLVSGQAMIEVSCTPIQANTTSASPGQDAPVYSINLESESVIHCTLLQISARRGQWVTLPASDACSSPTSNSSSVLVGWATSEDFPVAIAQRQVDNGWGAYETFDEDARLTGVFIPAGGATLVSAPGTLHAIWSNEREGQL